MISSYIVKKKICGKIEVRGMGIFTVPFVEEVKLKLVVKMTERSGERFPSKKNKQKILGKYFPRIDISKNDISANAKINLKIFELSNE